MYEKEINWMKRDEPRKKDEEWYGCTNTDKFTRLVNARL